MKPRFFASPLSVTDAIESACHTYSMIYDKPDEWVRLGLESYIHRPVANGERNQDQLTLKAIIMKAGQARAGRIATPDAAQTSPFTLRSKTSQLYSLASGGRKFTSCAAERRTTSSTSVRL
jgi:hypothetical protein